MGGAFRRIGAVVTGLVASAAVVAVVEALGARVYPLPPGIDPSNMQAVKAHMAQMPVGAFIFVLAAWALGAAAGPWVATRLSPSRVAVHGTIVGVILLAMCIANMVMLPHPIWFWIAALIVVPICAILGSRAAVAPEPDRIARYAAYGA